MDLATIKVVGELGAVGIALVAVYLNYKIVTNHENHFIKALKRNAEAFSENGKALQKLGDAIESLEEKLK